MSTEKTLGEPAQYKSPVVKYDVLDGPAIFTSSAVIKPIGYVSFPLPLATSFTVNASCLFGHVTIGVLCLP